MAFYNLGDYSWLSDTEQAGHLSLFLPEVALSLP